MLLEMLIGFCVGYFIGSVLDEDSIKEKALEVDNAFKLEIQKKKKNAVKCGIFDEDDDKLCDIEVESEKGVSESLYEGQVIYLYD